MSEMYPHMYQHLSVPQAGRQLHACVLAPNRHEALATLQDDHPIWNELDVYWHGSAIYDAQKFRVRPAKVNMWLEHA